MAKYEFFFFFGLPVCTDVFAAALGPPECWTVVLPPSTAVGCTGCKMAGLLSAGHKQQNAQLSTHMASLPQSTPLLLFKNNTIVINPTFRNNTSCLHIMERKIPLKLSNISRQGPGYKPFIKYFKYKFTVVYLRKQLHISAHSVRIA